MNWIKRMWRVFTLPPIQRVQGLIDSPERVYVFKVSNEISLKDVQEVTNIIRGMFQYSSCLVTPFIEVVEPDHVNNVDIETIILEELEEELRGN